MDISLRAVSYTCIDRRLDKRLGERLYLVGHDGYLLEGGFVHVRALQRVGRPYALGLWGWDIGGLDRS